MTVLSNLQRRVREADYAPLMGRVRKVGSLAVESRGPRSRLGELCELADDGGKSQYAEVTAMSEDSVVLMPYESTARISIGTAVISTGRYPVCDVGSSLLGRVIDGMGRPLDGRVLEKLDKQVPLYATPINPLDRAPITEVLETGIRAIDSLLTIGRGQRIGIFAGSGVGKSTLMGMLATHVQADVMVVALIGERGREVQSFVEDSLARADLHKTIVVAATSDQPALVRRRAAYMATSIAEYFRTLGKNVCLLMDSVTRFAMAQREIGLASGELPTARGYTPSVFSELPKLLERPGPLLSGGSITGIYTVLVDGDDFEEPITDAVRATLDGHIVLSRTVAQRGRYPAIDLTRSISRLAASLQNENEKKVVQAAQAALALYENSRDLIELGAYKVGLNVHLDAAIKVVPVLEQLFSQSPQASCSRAVTMQDIAKIMSARH